MTLGDSITDGFQSQANANVRWQIELDHLHGMSAAAVS
jgi:hypothetical protein